MWRNYQRSGSVDDDPLRLKRLRPEEFDAHGGQYECVLRNSGRRPDGRVVDQHRFTSTHEQYADATG